MNKLGKSKDNINIRLSNFYLCRIQRSDTLSDKVQNRLISLVGRVFANGPGDLGSIPGRVIPKTLKMVLDTILLNTQQYKVRIKGKEEQSWERSSALPLHLDVVAIEKGAFWLPSTTVANFTFYLHIYLPLRKSRMRHKINFPSFRLVVISRLKSTVCPIIYS